MKTKLSFVFLALPIALGAFGCSSPDAPAASAQEKKAFGGSAPPADYMKNVKTAAPTMPAGGGAPPAAAAGTGSK